MAFGVKQRAPQTVEKAVQLTLELESYLPMPGRRQPTLSAQEVALLETGDEDPAAIAAVTGVNKPKDPLHLILERLEQLEADLKVAKEEAQRRNQQLGERPITCRRCGQEGHIARGCRNRAKDSNFYEFQGNEQPSGQ